MSEQLHGKSEQLASASMQLEQKSEQLRSVSKQKIGMAYWRMCFVLLNNHIVADNYCACRARFGARPAAPSQRATPRGEGEGVKMSGEAG